jgi:hypothetical protein
LFEQTLDCGAVQVRLAHSIEIGTEQLINFLKFRRISGGSGAANGCNDKKTKNKISRVQNFNL